MITCRQKTSICGAGTITLADSSSTVVTRTLTGFSLDEKCSWVVQATKDAPTFKLESGTLGSKYAMHYVEYDSTVARE